MNYKMETIRKHFFNGRFDLFGIDTGYRFYPIGYKDKFYVVEISISPFYTGHSRDISEEVALIEIFNYEEQTTHFRHHKKEKIFHTFSPIVEIKDEQGFVKSLRLFLINKKDLILYLPQIMSYFFSLYEKQLEKEKALKEAKLWDGIVK